MKSCAVVSAFRPFLLQGVNTIPLLSPWSTVTIILSKLSSEGGRSVIKSISRDPKSLFDPEGMG